MVTSWSTASNLRKGAFYSGAILIADAIAIGLVSLINGRNLLSYYTLLTLLEAAVLLFTGGFRKPWIVPAGLQPDLRRDWSLIITGLILLASSFVLAYPLR